MKSRSHSSRAIVLSLEDFGEADRYVQLFTQNWGMITALAKSARKSKRRYVGGLDLFCHNEIFLRGDPKERPYLVELSVLNSFTGIRESLDRVTTAGKAIQWIRKLANIAVPMPQIYSLLGQTLALIEKESSPLRLELLMTLFKLKLLFSIGLKPRVDECVKCGEIFSEGNSHFDFDSGGILCTACFPKVSLQEHRILHSEVRSFIQWGDQAKLTLWDQIRLDEIHTRELSALLTHFASYHTQVKLPL